MHLINSYLMDVLHDYHLHTSLNDKNWVVVNKKLFMYCQLLNSFPTGIVEIEIGLGLTDNRIIKEIFAGSGANQEEAIRNAMSYFTDQSLKAILYTFFNRKDDSLTIMNWGVGMKRWRAILGHPYMRNIDPNSTIVNDFKRCLINTISIRPLPNPSTFHWCRAYYSLENEERNVVMARIDNEPWSDLEEAILRLPWPKQEGFYCLRQFIIFYQE